MNTEPTAFINLSQEVHQLHADLCAALADPTRILVLYQLAEAPGTVGELAVRLNISAANMSRHLKTLRERGLVRANRQAASVTYSLADERIINALDTLRSVLRDTLAHRASLIAQ